MGDVDPSETCRKKERDREGGYQAVSAMGSIYDVSSKAYGLW